MPTEKTEGPAGAPAAVVCPRCGASGPPVRTVAEACADPGSARSGLSDRLAKTPDVPSGSDSVMHVLEGMVLAGIGAGLAHSGVQHDKPPYTIGGTLLAVLLLVGTLVVIRGEFRERAAVAAGEPRAERVWRPAHHCASCACVFYPAGTPWPGPLTPDQFRKYVWTEAGFDQQIDERLRDVELPPGTPAGPSGPGGATGHA
ncbi:hypothetical protein WBG99_06905 [Streptomyces sp. TG1A-60]|uniref:hypothetical protein n=1 Tax=Streptomyces sp. TG1A-60 TaxID=3129111 RepID=UPI0030D095D5